MKHIPAEQRAPVPAAQVVQRAASSPVAVADSRRARAPRTPKIAVLTSELRERILEVYHESFAGRKVQTREIHTQIANKLWMKRQLVADVIRELVQPKVLLTDDLRARAVEMYKRFVESGHRPAGGRRRAISAALGLPYKQVMKAIRDWSMSEYSKSPNPNPSRQQLFDIERTYWQELINKRHRLTEFPDKIAEQLGFVTRWQVLRWLDVLHDDQHAFDNVPDPSPEAQAQILSAYQTYLTSAVPPEHGLHYSIAAQIPKVSPRQVHKILQSYRHQMRSEYPLV